jgi:putative transposase
MSRSRYKFGEAHYPHFITCTIVGWQPLFTRLELVEIVFDSWRSRTEIINCGTKEAIHR